MKLKKRRSGQIRILEAFFAALLIFASLFLIPSPPTSENNSPNDLYSIGMNTLLQLDADGSLSKLIKNKDWNRLRNILQQVLPNGVWFNLTVLNNAGAQLNDVLISNGQPISDKIVSIEYLCAASSPTYSIYIIYLQLARAS